MSRLSDLYKAMETLRKEGLSLNEDLEKQVSDLEENIIKKEDTSNNRLDLIVKVRSILSENGANFFNDNLQCVIVHPQAIINNSDIFFNFLTKRESETLSLLLIFHHIHRTRILQTDYIPTPIYEIHLL